MRALAGALLCLGLSPPAHSDSIVEVTKAEQVKAAYLRYIAEFTTWPEDTFPDGEASVVVCVLGPSGLGVVTALQGAIDRRGLSIQDRSLEVHVLSASPVAGNEADLGVALRACHVIFVARDKATDWPGVRRLVADRPIVTVSDIQGFANAEGMIEFVIDPEAGRVTMHIDLAAVRNARLRLSSRLLGLKQGVKIVRQPAREARCLEKDCWQRSGTALHWEPSQMRPGHEGRQGGGS